MNDDLVIKLITEQRKRLVASIMGAAESKGWWNKLTVQEQREYRSKVLDSIGVFYDLVRDVVKVSGDGWTVSDDALALIAQVHASQNRLEKTIGGVSA